jgi:hypothetical protein
LFGPSTEGTALRIQPGVFGTAANLLAWMADLPASGVAVKVQAGDSFDAKVDLTPI